MSFNRRIKPMITDEEPIDIPPIQEEAPKPVKIEEPKIGMTTGPVWLRETPEEDSIKINVVTSGQVIDILSVDGEFAKIKWHNETGYVKSAWIKEV